MNDPCPFHKKQGRFDPFCRNCQPLTEDGRRIKELEIELRTWQELFHKCKDDCPLNRFVEEKEVGDE